jgi:Sec-independent protein translocase protein TatA
MIRVILFALLIYFLYRFIFHFLVPVSKAAREMKNKMNEFQNRMQQQQGFSTRPEPAKEAAPQKKAGDYIDFEEVT